MLNYHSNKEEWGFKFHNGVKILPLFTTNLIPRLWQLPHTGQKPVPVIYGLF